MGFVFDSGFRATTGNVLMAAAATTPLTAGNTQSVTIPDTVRDGDLVLVYFASVGNPTVAWATPTGCAAVAAQKNASASIGGRVALFQKTWHTGDSKTFSSSGPGGNVVAVAIIVRSDTAGSSLVLGNPPLGGFAGTYSVEQTVAGTTITMPKIAVDSSTTDLRVVIIANGTSSTTLTPPNIASSANNLPGADPIELLAQASGTTLCVLVSLFLLADPALTETTTSTWTVASAKNYSLAFAIHDPNATVGGARIVREEPVCLAVGSLIPATVSGSGGGGGISVY